MADALITFSEGQDILVSEANQNNQFLLSKLSDNATQLTTYLEGQIASIQSNIASIQATLQANIDTANENITSSLKCRTFTQKAKSVSVGAVSLSSYLPNDGYAYLVWVCATKSAKNASTLAIKTDVI